MSKKYFKDTRPAVLLVDIQGDYENLINPQFEKAVKKLVHQARAEQVPIFHMRYVTSKKKTVALPFKFEIGKNRQSHATYKRRGDLFTWTQKRGDVVCTKHTYDSFFGTHLHSLLKKKRIKTLYIAGLETGVCVLNTLFSAFNHGYRIRLVESACVDSWPKRHTNTFTNYRNELYLPA